MYFADYFQVNAAPPAGLIDLERRLRRQCPRDAGGPAPAAARPAGGGGPTGRAAIAPRPTGATKGTALLVG